MARNESKKIIDYISEEEINDTPQNEAIQEFSKQLVEDYEYTKQRIQTRPQYRLTDPESNKSRHCGFSKLRKKR